MEGSQDRPVTPRWYQRALPVTGLVLAVLALAALVFPAVRHQVTLSTTRQPQPFVELYFSKSRPADRVACGKEVRFTVVSHLEESRRLEYDVSAGPAERAGSVRVDPGQARQVRVRVDAPGAHVVGVRLPALGQHVSLHCDGSRR